MNVLILGSGMYVTGKNHAKTGTVLSSIIQSSKVLTIEKIIVVSYSKSSENHTLNSAECANAMLNTNVPVSFYCLEDKKETWFLEFVIKEKFDLCVNSLPDHLHFKYAQLTLRHMIPTLVVKPLTPTYQEALELLETTRDVGTYCAVEFHKRWDESNLYLKQSILNQKIGELLYFSVDYSQQISIPTKQFREWSSKTNIFQYLGVHYVDLIYFVTGKKPKSLSTYGTRKKLLSLGIDTWDSVHVSSIWGDNTTNENDFYVHFNLNWIDSNETSAMSDQKLIAVGTEGRIDLDQKNRGVSVVTNDGGVQSVNPYFATWLPDDNGGQRLNGYGFESIYTFVSDVSKLHNSTISVTELMEKRPGIESSLVSTKFIDKVTQCLKEGNVNQIELC